MTEEDSPVYFHPPTFDPGPAATLIGLGVLLFLVAQPLLMRPLVRRLGEPAEPGRPSALMRINLLGVWLSPVEILAAVAFVGSARVVTSADIGLIVPRVQEDEPDVLFSSAGDLMAWGGTIAASVWLALFAVVLLVERSRCGAASPRSTTAQAGPSLPTDTELRWTLWSFALSSLSNTAALFVVVYPLVTVFVGPPAAVVAIALLLGWQQWGGGPLRMLRRALYGLLMALSHALLFSGSLFVPLAVWGLIVYLRSRSVRVLRQRLLQLPQTESEPPPLQVTMLDADGNPVQRPGR
nr:hypothetical protein [Nocardiopsis sinuspersici]